MSEDKANILVVDDLPEKLLKQVLLEASLRAEQRV